MLKKAQEGVKGGTLAGGPPLSGRPLPPAARHVASAELAYTLLSICT